MTTPQEDAIRRVIADIIAPRVSDQHTYLAASVDDPLPVARADLLYLRDEYNAELLNFDARLAPIGYQHQLVVGTVSEHMRYYLMTAPHGQHVQRWPVQYAKDLSEALSGPDELRKVLFCEGEREAVRMAVRLADGGKDALVLDTGCHDWLLADTGYDLVDPLNPGTVAWDRYGALLLSTVRADARPLPVEVLRTWVLTAREHQIPVIVDESVTGFGRTGLMWGQEHLGLIADVTVLGGPVGGGFPLGAVVLPTALVTGPPDISPQAGNPIACATGASTLSLTHEGLVEHVAEAAQVLQVKLGQLVEQFPECLRGHHGVGLLRGLVFTDPDLAAVFPRAARDHGLHLAPALGDTILIAPTLVSSINEMERGVDLIADTLLSVADAVPTS